MGKIVVTTNVTLDGFVQDPDGLEETRLGGWFRQSGGKDLEPWTRIMTDETLAATAMLLGRRSDEWFAERWNDRDGEWADKLRDLPKYVVSGTVTKGKWAGPSKVLAGDPVREVAKVRQDVAGDILVYASYQLVATLIENDLVDEIRLVVFPVLLGDGQRLFGKTSGMKPLRLASTSTIGDGLIQVTYQVVRDA